jgi:hypothetical protein
MSKKCRNKKEKKQPKEEIEYSPPLNLNAAVFVPTFQIPLSQSSDKD